MAMNSHPKYRIGGVFVNDLDYHDIANLTTEAFKGDKARLFFSMNGEGIANYNINLDFKRCVDEADYIHADGWSTMMAGRLFTEGEFPVRLATTDCYRNILEAAEKSERSVFFLGASEEVINTAVNNIQNEFRLLKVAGFSSGYFSNESEILHQINNSRASIVFVGLGRPKQEDFALRIRDNCPNVKLIKTCGGLFDFLSGKNRRAPLILQKYGFEWAYRLYQEPRRLFFRYLWTNFYSLFLYFTKSGS